MKRTFIVLTMALLPVVGFAEKSGYKKMRYGMAGCGPASIFIQDNTMLPQVGKVLADYVVGLASTNTSAMTTGTSNCTNNPSDSAALMEQEVFVSMNYNTINKEAAQGSGEHLVAFAQVLGCEEAAFGEFTKSNHSEIFSASEPKAMLENVRGLIQKGDRLSCERI